MIGVHVYVFFTFFGPDLEEKEEDKKGQFLPVFEPLLFMVDISHMRMPTPASQSIEVCDICICMCMCRMRHSKHTQDYTQQQTLAYSTTL